MYAITSKIILFDKIIIIRIILIITIYLNKRDNTILSKKKSKIMLIITIILIRGKLLIFNPYVIPNYILIQPNYYLLSKITLKHLKTLQKLISLIFKVEKESKKSTENPQLKLTSVEPPPILTTMPCSPSLKFLLIRHLI